MNKKITALILFILSLVLTTTVLQLGSVYGTEVVGEVDCYDNKDNKINGLTCEEEQTTLVWRIAYIVASIVCFVSMIYMVACYLDIIM